MKGMASMETIGLTQLQTERQRLLKKRKLLLDSFTTAVHSGKKGRFSKLYLEIRANSSFLRSLDQIEASGLKTQENAVQRYAVSSLFLHESFKKLTADQDEQFFFVTGSEVEDRLVLDQWAEFAHQKRGMLGVTADTRSTHGLLIRLEQFGHRLLAHFHSHPGRGPDATKPSGTDEGYQGRLERTGHRAIMAIFSRDGYVRFVRLDQNFEIEIFGTGVEKHAPGIYRLTNIDPS
jgi:hypothetical protein